MIFESATPSEDGRYRWRVGKGDRIHLVTVKTRRGVTSMICSTMAAQVLKSTGEWSLIERASSSHLELEPA